MFEYMNQINQIRQQVSQSGFSGTAVIDAHPKTGISSPQDRHHPA
jgi:hypothetical protein